MRGILGSMGFIYWGDPVSVINEKVYKSAITANRTKITYRLTPEKHTTTHRKGIY